MDFDLDNLEIYKTFDPDAMGARIREFPTQLRDAWALGQRLLLPDDYRRIRRVIVTGMGGSAIGGELLSGLMARDGAIPWEVVRGYDLPAYVTGPETLVVGSSYSGNTEETLSAFEQAHTRGARLLAVTTGGEIAAMAEQMGAPVWLFSYEALPRAALGYGFALLLGLACRLGFYPDSEAALASAIAALEEMQVGLTPDVSARQNPAKQMAQALYSKLPAVFAAGFLLPVARRWKGQFNENAKQWALWDEMPELNHNSVVGFSLPETVRTHLAAVFLRSELDHPRVKVRWDVTQTLLERDGVAWHTVCGQGKTPLAQMLSLIHFGDFVSYYAAALNDADPSPIGNIAYLKAQLADVG